MAKNDNGMMTILWIALALGALASMFAPNNNSAPTPSTFNVDENSFEHRYVKERFKLEGYSDADSKKAANAVIKFHNAQQK